MLKPDEVAYILRHAGAEMLAPTPALPRSRVPPPRATPRCASLSGCRRRRRAPPAPGMIAFDALAGQRRACPQVELAGGDLAQIVYTSGTESLPKGAMLTHDAVIWQYVSCVVDAEIAGRRTACCTRCRFITARSSTCSWARRSMLAAPT